MCSRITRIRGLKIGGRSVYRTDTGVKVGFRGPTVELQSVLDPLSMPAACSLKDACQAIDDHYARLEQADVVLEAPQEIIADQSQPQPTTDEDPNTKTPW